MRNKLKAYNKDGKVIHYTSSWTPNKEKDEYHWKLFTGSADKKNEVMNGTFKKE